MPRWPIRREAVSREALLLDGMSISSLFSLRVSSSMPLAPGVIPEWSQVQACA